MLLLFDVLSLLLVMLSVSCFRRSGAPRRETAVDKPAASRAEIIAEHKSAKLFGNNPRLEAIIEGVSVPTVAYCPQQ